MLDVTGGDPYDAAANALSTASFPSRRRLGTSVVVIRSRSVRGAMASTACDDGGFP